MIYNFYTYIFISALTASAAFVILLRTVFNRQRRRIWDVSSVSFLVLLIISVVVFFAGLIIVDSNEITFLGALAFFMLNFIFSSILFYFLRLFSVFVILCLILGSVFLYSSQLEGFKAFGDSNHFVIKTLQYQNGAISLEVVDFGNDVDFQSYEESRLYPVFLIIDFPKFLFFLESSSYIKFTGFINDIEEANQRLETDYMKSKVSKLPFARIRVYEFLVIEREIYSTFKVDLKHNGTFKINVEK